MIHPVIVLLLLLPGAVALDAAAPWPCHVIDGSSAGADGVRLADCNGDGRPDIATGWEEGGETRVYLHPGPDGVRHPWPAVSVGPTPSVEDAVFADIDGDGRLDVVSACEGDERRLYVHFAQEDAARWRREPLPAAAGRMRWMFVLPMDIDGRHGIDLVAGGKNDGAALGWFEAPASGADLGAWRWHPLTPAGWVMSLIPRDMDGDGDLDVVYTDRRGPRRGVRWLEHPGPDGDVTGAWRSHPVDDSDGEFMFMALGDLDGDGLEDAAAAVRLEAGEALRLYRRRDATGRAWETHTVPLPDWTGTAKAVAIGDLDGDGNADLAATTEHAEGDRRGVFNCTRDGDPWSGGWTARAISGARGIKFDRIELVDLDEDGDLDLLTCEERAPDAAGRPRGIGVHWYENPSEDPAPVDGRGS